jgi:hypothetical protein
MHFSRTSPQSHLLSFSSSITPACFWLVAVFKYSLLLLPSLYSSNPVALQKSKHSSFHLFILHLSTCNAPKTMELHFPHCPHCWDFLSAPSSALSACFSLVVAYCSALSACSWLVVACCLGMTKHVVSCKAWYSGWVHG